MGWAWVSMHWAGAVNKHICYCSDSRELVTEARGHRHVCQWDSSVVTTPGYYCSQGGIHRKGQESTNRQSVMWRKVMRGNYISPHQSFPLLVFPVPPSKANFPFALCYLLPLSLPFSSHPIRGRRKKMYWQMEPHYILSCEGLAGPSGSGF